MKRFLISIGIPVYNGERFLRESIKSALSQSWSEKEILVVDDGSTDSTQSIIRSFQGNIRSFRIEHQGVSKARNVILKESKGLWIQYLDADDYLLEDKIETQIKECPNIQKYDVLLGDCSSKNGKEAKEKRIVFNLNILRTLIWIPSSNGSIGIIQMSPAAYF
ncbi:glycosyltransferase family 2 protein [Methylacidiphilum kamchatkense]|uniref:Glycosyl transferase family 2 n=1 Tax=Methylacidiphilum kamchatkense Kam1 TaxID=1202785 RepID=A0A516TPW9_9BACT|nr:glycosyltransferase family A protein [Methylacidiphilum kamchatkense]QDQ43293.1 glycosyl transferase family 2 [Methylacidiphilum kamchatkense Kam1]